MKRPVVVGLSVNVMTRTLRRISGPLLPLLLVAAPALAQILGEHEVAPPFFGAAPASASQIAAARVATDGTIVDRAGIQIAYTMKGSLRRCGRTGILVRDAALKQV